MILIGIESSAKSNFKSTWPFHETTKSIGCITVEKPVDIVALVHTSFSTERSYGVVHNAGEMQTNPNNNNAPSMQFRKFCPRRNLALCDLEIQIFLQNF